MKIILSTFVLIISFTSFSQTLAEIQALNFGTVVVASNSSVNTISIDKEGNYRITGDVYVIEAGEPAIFEASGFLGNQQLNITITSGQSATSTVEFSPEQFSVQEYKSEDLVKTNATGSATFFVGGVFTTSGNGSTNFRDSEYNANYTVTINF
jgi:hypothetical protein